VVFLAEKHFGRQAANAARFGLAVELNVLLAKHPPKVIGMSISV
jgi:hypothetical protein